jgi:hypothetical protein
MLAALRARRGAAPAATPAAPASTAADPAADALAARTEARRLQARAQAIPEASEPALARMIAEAGGELDRGEAASDAGDTHQALAHFRRAKSVLESVFKASKPLAECVGLSMGTERAEAAARELRADGFAPRDFDAAVRAADAAARAREAGDFGRAGRYYGEATAAYDLASETAQRDASLRSEALALHAKGIQWRFRDEPALRRMLERADSAAAKVEDALSGRDREEAVRLAREAKGLYEDAFGLEHALRDCLRIERETRSLLDECVRLEAERHAAGALAGGTGLLEQSKVFRSEGDFAKATAIMREARDALRGCRDACLRARGRHLSGVAIKLLALLILMTAVIAIIVWALSGYENQSSGGGDRLPGDCRPGRVEVARARRRVLRGGAGPHASRNAGPDAASTAAGAC